MSDERSADDAEKSTEETTSKVGRLIAEYELDGIGSRLERRWVGDAETNDSLRDLADVFNVALLRAKLAKTDEDPLDGEAENLYRLLTADVGPAERTRARRRLERAGIDVDALTTDFVSHQAIHTYLTEYRGAEYSTDESGSQIERDRTRIRKAQNRLAAVVEDALSNLVETERLSLGRFNVLVEVRVVCQDCGQSSTVGELLTEGGCDCE